MRADTPSVPALASNSYRASKAPFHCWQQSGPRGPATQGAWPNSVQKVHRSLNTFLLQQLTPIFHRSPLISSPARLFRNLNIGAMPVTRFQTHFSRGRGRGGRRPGRAPLPPALPIPGYAGFRYDTQHLSPVSAERAAEGIEAGFILHSLKSMTDGRDRYIAFQLHVPVAIRIYDPVIQQLQPIRATCNCIDYRSTQTACAHLYVSQYLVYTVFALTCIVALYTLECCVKRRSARKSAKYEQSRLNAGRSSFRVKCSISSNRATT